MINIQAPEAPLTEVYEYKGTPWKPLTLHQNRFLRVVHNGQFHYVEGVHYHAGVVIVPVLPSGDFVMVEVERAPAVGRSLEFPRGGVERGEDLGIAATRELMEETGYAAIAGKYLGKVAGDSATLNALVDVFLVNVHSSPLSMAMDTSEIANVIVVERRALLELVRSGRIVCGYTLSSLLLFEWR